MRHEHDRRVELEDRLLQPLDGLDVEVVGGLVQQQHVRARHQRPRQRRAGQLTAGEAHQRARQPLLVDAETAQHALHPRPPGVAAGALEPRLGALVGRHDLGPGVAGRHARLELGQVALGPPRRLHPLADVLLQGQVGPERRALVVQGDGGALAACSGSRRPGRAGPRGCAAAWSCPRRCGRPRRAGRRGQRGSSRRRGRHERRRPCGSGSPARPTRLARWPRPRRSATPPASTPWWPRRAPRAARPSTSSSSGSGPTPPSRAWPRWRRPAASTWWTRSTAPRCARSPTSCPTPTSRSSCTRPRPTSPCSAWPSAPGPSA